LAGKLTPQEGSRTAARRKQFGGGRPVQPRSCPRCRTPCASATRAQRTCNGAVCCGASDRVSIREGALSKVEISRHQAACHRDGCPSRSCALRVNIPVWAMCSVRSQRAIAWKSSGAYDDRVLECLLVVRDMPLHMVFPQERKPRDRPGRLSDRNGLTPHAKLWDPETPSGERDIWSQMISSLGTPGLLPVTPLFLRIRGHSGRIGAKQVDFPTSGRLAR
jgi:hypothetical protein